MFFWGCLFVMFVRVIGQDGWEVEEEWNDAGPDCIVHHPPHNDEFSCGSLCDPSLLNAEIVRAVYLTSFYANFDCLINKTSIVVSEFSASAPFFFHRLFISSSSKLKKRVLN
jgi:hypothetical protein